VEEEKKELQINIKITIKIVKETLVCLINDIIGEN
jgi:hypothetical protein